MTLAKTGASVSSRANIITMCLSFNRSVRIPVIVLGAVLFASRAAAETTVPAVTSANPLLTESSLPYHLPPFEQIKPEHFAPAFALGMEQELKEVAAIANNPAVPTFDNTIVALERSGELLNRVSTAFGILTGANTNPELDKLESVITPKLAAHRDAILLNPALFARIEALYAKRDQLGLDPESLR